MLAVSNKYLGWFCSIKNDYVVFISVCLPFQRQKFCTTRRAKMVVLGLALFAAVTYSFGAWTMGPVYIFPLADPPCT